MTTTLRAVEAAADLDLNDRVRLVVRVLLAMQRMTQLELGRQLGLPPTPIRNRMQGRTPFTVSEIGQMSQIFGIPPDAFFVGPSALIGAAAKPRADTASYRPARSVPVATARPPRLRAVA